MKRASAAILVALLALPAHAQTAPDASATPAPAVAPASDTIEGIEVLTAREKILRDFVRAYATPSFTGQFARWGSGVCPQATGSGLAPDEQKRVAARVTEVAALVGAPVAKSGCRPNIQFIFTGEANELVKAVQAKGHSRTGLHYQIAQSLSLATANQSIQAWYATATVDENGVATANAPNNFGCTRQPGSALGDYCMFAATGSHLGIGLKSVFDVISIVVDMTKIGDTDKGALADYLAMLSLAEPKSFDACRGLASISNLMAADCAPEKKTASLSPNDLAYLRGLYQMNASAAPQLQVVDLAKWMKTSLDGPQSADAAALPQHAEPDVEGITVLGAQEKMIRDFVRSYAAPAQSLIGQIARWNKPVCPVVSGLAPALNQQIAARVKQIAADVGAKVDAKDPCEMNIQIAFTREPQALIDSVRKQAPWMLGSHYKAQEQDLATMRYPIQAWYATATADARGTLSLDDIGDNSGKCTYSIPSSMCATMGGFRGVANAPGNCEIQASSCNNVRASRTGQGFRSEFALVSVVVDVNRIGEYVAGDIPRALTGPIADYIALVALSQTKAFDTCRGLLSISNLPVKGCDVAKKALTLTATDLAYLGALYKMNSEAAASLQQSEIANWMKINLDNPG